mgnify:FL=1
MAESNGPEIVLDLLIRGNAVDDERALEVIAHVQLDLPDDTGEIVLNGPQEADGLIGQPVVLIGPAAHEVAPADLSHAGSIELGVPDEQGILARDQALAGLDHLLTRRELEEENGRITEVLDASEREDGLSHVNLLSGKDRVGVKLTMTFTHQHPNTICY